MSIPASNSNPVRLGLVGAGRWGRIYLKTLAALPGVAVAGLASGNPDAATWVPPGCRVFSHWREMIAAGELDGVIIATPPSSHAEIVYAAMAAGLPALVEKPLTMDAAEADSLLAEAGRCQPLVRVDHIHLYSPAFRQLLRLTAHSGPILAVRAQAGNFGPYRAKTPVLWDWGSHDVAMMLALAGSPQASSATRLERREVDGSIGEMLRLDLSYAGFAATIVIGTLMEKCRRFEVECRDALLVYDDLAEHKLTRDGQPVAVDPTPPLSVAVSEFAQAIRQGTRDWSDMELGARTVRLLSGLAAALD